MKIIAVGDIMPGGVLSVTNTEFATEEVRRVLAKGDLRVGNFECAVEVSNPKGKKYEAGGNTIFCRAEDVKRVKDLGFDVVSIANNHLFDLGPEGAFKAIETLDNLGIFHCGAGRNLAEAQKPVVIEREGKTYAFLAFCDTRWNYMYEATENAPGVNPLREDYVVNEIRAAKREYNHVIVIPHWGKENTYFPTQEMVRLSKRMVDAGACLVLGGHTHRVQPIIRIRRKTVVYSMGNFLFSNRIINSPKYTYYPVESIDVKTLPSTIGIPVVDRPTVKLWRPLAYIGMIVNAIIYEDIDVRISYLLTYTNMDNCVGLLQKNEKRIRRKLYLLGLVIKCNLYRPMMFVLNHQKKLKQIIDGK